MEDPFQHQLEAFNNRDIDSFMKAFADDATVENGSGDEMMNGSEQRYIDIWKASSELPTLIASCLDLTNSSGPMLSRNQLR